MLMTWMVRSWRFCDPHHVIDRSIGILSRHDRDRRQQQRNDQGDEKDNFRSFHVFAIAFI